MDEHCPSLHQLLRCGRSERLRTRPRGVVKHEILLKVTLTWFDVSPCRRSCMTSPGDYRETAKPS